MATTDQVVSGVMYVSIDGVSYRAVGEGTYRVTSGNRESLVGQDGYHGYKSMPMAGKMKWKGRDSSALSMKALADAVGSNVTFELANGKTVVGRQMVRVGEPPEVSTEDSTFDVEFDGPDVREA